MSAFLEETVLSVHHWTDRLFSFTTTRDTTLRFSNGHFTMIGLRQENGKPLLEVFLLDFQGDLYGRRIVVEFVRRIRAEEKFDSLEIMTEQMHRDADNARRLLSVQRLRATA